MHWLARCLCCLSIACMCTASKAEDTSIEQTESARSSQSNRSLDVRFQLDSAELQIGEDLTVAQQHYGKGEWQKAVDQLSTFLSVDARHARFIDALFRAWRIADATSRLRHRAKRFRATTISETNPDAGSPRTISHCRVSHAIGRASRSTASLGTIPR